VTCFGLFGENFSSIIEVNTGVRCAQPLNEGTELTTPHFDQTTFPSAQTIQGRLGKGMAADLFTRQTMIGQGFSPKRPQAAGAVGEEY